MITEKDVLTPEIIAKCQLLQDKICKDLNEVFSEASWLSFISGCSVLTQLLLETVIRQGIDKDLLVSIITGSYDKLKENIDKEEQGAKECTKGNKL